LAGQGAAFLAAGGTRHWATSALPCRREWIVNTKSRYLATSSGVAPIAPGALVGHRL